MARFPAAVVTADGKSVGVGGPLPEVTHVLNRGLRRIRPRRYDGAMKAPTLRRFLNAWPPFLFAGIRVVTLDDYRYARVKLKLAWYNRNYVRTQFGGNLFSMTDPFWMIMVLKSLGNDYIVWDQAGEIRFVAPGREDVFAEFRVEEAMLDELRAATANGEKHLRWFDTDIRTASGELVATVRKQLYVRRKKGR
jgi:acyl-coenzyme A thioesterase PaaI-like protein